MLFGGAAARLVSGVLLLLGSGNSGGQWEWGTRVSGVLL